MRIRIAGMKWPLAQGCRGGRRKIWTVCRRLWKQLKLAFPRKSKLSLAERRLSCHRYVNDSLRSRHACRSVCQRANRDIASARRDLAQKVKSREGTLVIARAYIKESTYSLNIQSECQKKYWFAWAGAAWNRWVMMTFLLFAPASKIW